MVLFYHNKHGGQNYTAYMGILAINNYYGLIRINNGYIDYFYICIKDLIRLLNPQHPIINPYKYVFIWYFLHPNILLLIHINP